MNKITDGKWFYIEDAPNIFYISNGRKTIAWTSEVEQETGNYAEGEAKANACLIAHAPALLKVCERVLFCEEKNGVISIPCLDELKHIITKAKGGGIDEQKA